MRTRRVKINQTNSVKPNLYCDSRIKRRKASQNVPISIRLDFNSLDNDILSKIFSFIHFEELAQISCVSKIFNNTYAQKVYWKNLYLTTFSKHINTENKIVNWKQIYVNTIRKLKTNKLNTFFKKILKRAKINYTLPNTQKLLNALNIEYIVYINNILIPHDKQYSDRNNLKQIRSFDICNVLKIQHNQLLSQFTLEDIKTVTIKMKSDKFFESIDIQFDINWCQMKIIKNIDKNKNDTIQLYSHNNIHFAVYDKDNIAFIVVALNHYNLLSSIAPRLFRFDKLSYVGKENKKCNFYGWKCQIMFRNLKKIFYHSKFYELIPTNVENKADTLIEFKLLGDTQNDSQIVDRFPIYPWKSDTFKGKENGVFEVDIILLNDKNHILFAKSFMVNSVPIKDLYNFDDQTNDDERYLFMYKNSNLCEMFNMVSGNFVVLDKFNNCCNIQKLSIYLSL